MSSEHPGRAIPILLLAAFRTVIDDLHAELAQVGHADARPMHAFVLQALGPDGASISELARRLGVTKQAAAKHVHALDNLGYVELAADPGDGRSRLVRPTPRGEDLIAASARLLDALERRWADQVGAQRLTQLVDDLEKLSRISALRTDLLGWLGAQPDFG